MNITRGLWLSTLVGTVAAATPGTDNTTGPVRPQMSAAQAAEHTAAHYLKKFRVFLGWWKARGYVDGIPQEAPAVLEAKKLAPSWRRMCKALLRNDYWCKGLGFSQPKSEAYGKYLQIKHRRKRLEAEAAA